MSLQDLNMDLENQLHQERQKVRDLMKLLENKDLQGTPQDKALTKHEPQPG